MNESESTDRLLRGLRHSLEAIFDLTNHIYQTGALKQSRGLVLRQYRFIVDQVKLHAPLSDYLLPDLEEDASLDEIGAASRLIAAHLEWREREESGSTGPEASIASPALGNWVREHLPSILGIAAPETSPPPASEESRDLPPRERP